jgi:hypothetical protein
VATRLSLDAFSILVAARGFGAVGALAQVDPASQAAALEMVRGFLTTPEARAAAARALWKRGKGRSVKALIESLDLRPGELWALVSAPLATDLGFPKEAADAFRAAFDAKGHGPWRAKAKALGCCVQFPTDLMLKLVEGEGGFSTSERERKVLHEALVQRVEEPAVTRYFVKSLGDHLMDGTPVRALMAHPQGGALVAPGSDAFREFSVQRGTRLNAFRGEEELPNSGWLDSALTVWSGHPTTPVDSVVLYCLSPAGGLTVASSCARGLAKRREAMGALIEACRTMGVDPGYQAWGTPRGRKWCLGLSARGEIRKKAYPFRNELLNVLGEMGLASLVD